MDPMIDLDRELTAAMQVEPAGDFAARVRERVAREARRPRTRLPLLALACAACAIVAVLAANVWRQAPAQRMPGDPSALRAQNRITLAPLVASARSESPQPRANVRTTAAPAIDVMVSRSEMLALQRLFSGATVAPPPVTPVADELSIPELALEPIPVLTIPEGDRQ